MDQALLAVGQGDVYGMCASVLAIAVLGFAFGALRATERPRHRQEHVRRE
jgi:hypothetical protein